MIRSVPRFRFTSWFWSKRASEIRNPQQHTFPGAEVQVCPDDIGKIALKQHAAVFRLDIGEAQPPQLLGGDALQSEQAGDAAGKT